jgi:Tol biopolymer transport system component
MQHLQDAAQRHRGDTADQRAGGNIYPSFSPDGSRIVFTSFRDSNAGDSNAEIYVMNADGTGQTR